MGFLFEFIFLNKKTINILKSVYSRILMVNKIVLVKATPSHKGHSKIVLTIFLGIKSTKSPIVPNLSIKNISSEV